MKLKIYAILAVILMFAFFMVVLFYYTQNFKEEFVFYNVDYHEIYVESYDNELYSAEAKIGELTLINEGYFTQLYTIPELVGCLDLTEGESLKFNIFTKQESNKEIKIKVGENKSFDIYTIYSQKQPMSVFAEENLNELKIYKIPEKPQNPLSSSKIYYGEDIYYNDYRVTCDVIESEYEQIGVVGIV